MTQQHDLRDQFDRMIDAANRHSLILQLSDKVKYAIDGGKRECGSCQLWMTSKCPQERNVNGRKVGPSMSGYPCSQFARTASAIRTQRGRIEDAIAFAAQHDLPVPQLESAKE
jgi:hypothetical protein